MSERSNLFDQINLEETGSVARLRGFVLDLAVRGRLVPQIAAEGSGSSLVAGLRGADRKRDPANEQGPPFDVPPSWTWSTVGSVSSYVQRGKGPDYVETSTVPVVSQKCVQWEGFLMERARFIDPKSLSAYGEERLLRDGDLLWNSTGHGTVGRVAVFRSDPRYPRVVADSHVTIVRPEIEPRFLWCWLASPTVQRTIDDLVSGTTKQTELSTSTVVAHPVPVPPLAEQKRIVAKVDQLMALCDDLEARQTKKRDTSSRLTKSALQALTTAEGPEEFDLAWKRVVENFDVLIDRAEKVGELRRAVLDLAVRGSLLGTGARGPRREGDPFPVPAEWTWTSFGELCDDITVGHVGTMASRYVADGIPFLRTMNVGEFRFLRAGLKFIDARFHAELRKSSLVGGEILAVRSGYIGRACVFPPDEGPANCSDLVILRPGVRLDPHYGCIVLNSPYGVAHVLSERVGIAQGHFNVKSTRQMPTPTPPLAEQKRIVAKVEQLMKVCDELEARLTRAEDRASKLVEAVVEQLTLTGV